MAAVDAVELLVAAETGFEGAREQRGVGRGGLVFGEAFEAEAIAEIDERYAGLLTKEFAQSCAAEAGLMGDHMMSRGLVDNVPPN